MLTYEGNIMRSLLLVVALLFSSLALAEDTTLVLTGFTAEEGQIIEVELRGAENYYMTMLRSPTDIAEGDDLEIVLEDAQPGVYDMRIRVREYIARNERFAEKMSTGKVLKQQITQIVIE